MKTPCTKCGGDTYLCQVCAEVRCDCTHHSTWNECLPPKCIDGVLFIDDVVWSVWATYALPNEALQMMIQMRMGQKTAKNMAEYKEICDQMPDLDQKGES